MSSAQRVTVVPHTHWDREWYEPFQTFRLRLVDVVDGLLDLMESDETYARFLLDGQMAVVDDYLEVRPENEKRLRALTESGWVSCGPWYILMDEFLVSGETIIRNLQMGLERAADFGGAMEIGYLPDMFGHIAQMPQILNQAGLDQAVVWRGVPSVVDKMAFWWSSPDGSRVRAQYLNTGYGEGSAIADDAPQLARRVAAFRDRNESFLLGPILLMNGNDHEAPQPWLGAVVAEANRLQDDFEIEITSLAEALQTMPTEGLPAWTGELRSGARANLLMGVASNHVDVRKAAAHSEQSIERLAEPLATLFLPASQYPAHLFAIAWREIVRNSAHDSVCACSEDEVVRAVLHRYGEARQIADGIRDKALASLARSFAEPGHMVLNPAARPRGGVIELVLAGSENGEGEQSVSNQAGLDAELVLSVEQVRGVLGQIDNDQIGRDAYVTGVELTDIAPDAAGDNAAEEPIVLDIAVSVGPDRRPDLGLDTIRRDLEARLALWQGGRVRVRLAHMASRRVLARVEDVAGLGWKPYRPQPLEHPVAVSTDPGGSITLQNGLIQVVIDPTNGTFSLDGTAGMNMLVDSGDHGDTYNYSPPAHDIVVDSPDSTELSVEEEGPVRAIANIRRTYRWPERIDDAALARVGEKVVTVDSVMEVRAGERFVRITTRFDNPCRDHRLRAVFPLPEAAAFSRAECAFGTVERGLEAEGGPSEKGLPTYPARRVVQAGGLTMCQDGLIEYELVDIADGGARAIAVALLRSTGVLSRLTMINRPLPAGPNLPTESAQLIGPIEARYFVAGGDVDPYAFSDEALLPLIVVPTLGGGTRPAEGSALTIAGAEVSALHRSAGGAAELRVFNPTGDPAAVTVSRADAPVTGAVVDLRGREVEPFDGALSLGPWRFATIRLDEG